MLLYKMHAYFLEETLTLFFLSVENIDFQASKLLNQFKPLEGVTRLDREMIPTPWGR